MGLPVPRFDRRCQISRLVVTRDSDGGPVNTFSTYRTVWCRRVDRSGREFRASGALHSETTALFYVRYYDDIGAEDRIVCEGRTYEIISPPMEVGRRQGLMIQTAERLGST